MVGYCRHRLIVSNCLRRPFFGRGAGRTGVLLIGWRLVWEADCAHRLWTFSSLADTGDNGRQGRAARKTDGGGTVSLRPLGPNLLTSILFLG